MRRNRDFIGPAGMGGMVGLWGASSLIASVQRGTISLNAATSATATINAVNTNFALVQFLNYTTTYQNGPNGTQSRDYKPRLELTNSTTVTASKNLATSSSDIVPYEVIEFMPGAVRSVQKGTIQFAGGSPYTATIASINSAKSLLFHLGSSDPTTNTYDVPNYINAALVLTNDTTVTASSGVGSFILVGYQVVEFF